MKHLYLHVPFCQNICFYCDFKRNIYQSEMVDKWLKKIIQEVQKKHTDSSLETIYIGGGTPTSLSLLQLQELLEAIQPYSKHCIEYTIEANVESISEPLLILLKQYGVNRISLGIQSFQPTLLKEMNRSHTVSQIEKAMILLHKHQLSNVSIDLMYGFEGQTMNLWKEDLHQSVNMPFIKHLSLYSLTIEENSVFGRQNKKTCDRSLEEEMYAYAQSFLKEQGFIQYEVSNFAKEGYESKHNIGYWQYNDFYGIGVGASGKENHERYEIVGSIKDYIEKETNMECIALTVEEEMFEQIMMSLRMKQGLDEQLFLARYHMNIWEVYENELAFAIEHKYLQYQKPYIQCTEKGLLYLHDVLIPFMR